MKQWTRVRRSAKGDVTVTVTVSENGLTVGWSVRTYASTIKEGVREAKAEAIRALHEIREAVDEG